MFQTTTKALKSPLISGQGMSRSPNGTMRNHPINNQMSTKSHVIENQVQNVLSTAKCKLSNLDQDIEELEQ